jgi:Domain of unknown function (DUF5134)
VTGPPWIAAPLAAVMLLIAVGSATRLVMWRLRGRAAEPEADALHLMMGVSMAGMLEPVISPVPAVAWLVLFGAAAAWFAWRAIRVRSQKRRGPGSAIWRCAHPAPHAVESAAMLYMLVPADARGGMVMGGMARGAPTVNPAVVFVLALFMLGYILWTADRMTRQARASTAPSGCRPPGSAESAGCDLEAGVHRPGAVLAPRAVACSKIAMSLAMGYMLLSML